MYRYLHKDLQNERSEFFAVLFICLDGVAVSQMSILIIFLFQLNEKNGIRCRAWVDELLTTLPTLYITCPSNSKRRIFECELLFIQSYMYIFLFIYVFLRGKLKAHRFYRLCFNIFSHISNEIRLLC